MKAKPILEKLAQEYADRVEFLPINADESREVLEQFHVLGIPTVLILRKGKVDGRVTGAQNEAYYRTLFEAAAKGETVKVPFLTFDRLLRLSAGALFMMIGIFNGLWVLVAGGGVLVFMGVYDRCPAWTAVTSRFQRK